MTENLTAIIVGKNDTIQTSTLWLIYIVGPLILTLIIITIYFLLKKRKGGNG